MPQAAQGEHLVIDPATRDLIAGGGEPRWALFLSYWQDLAAHLGRLPARRELDPLDIPRVLLPNIYLIDIEPPASPRGVLATGRPRFRFRLLGDAIVAREVVRPGIYLDELASAEDLAEIERHYYEAMQGRIRLRAQTLSWESRHKEHVTYKTIILPLADDTGAVAHLIGFAIYDNERL